MRGLSSLGPVDFLGEPSGGESLFLTNQEIRFPVWPMFDGAGCVAVRLRLQAEPAAG